MHATSTGAARTIIYEPGLPHSAPGDEAGPRAMACSEASEVGYRSDARPCTVRQDAARRAAVRQADALAMSVSGALDRIAVPLARAASALVHCKGWFELGFARLEDHARERFGRSGRWARDMGLLGDALARLPALEAALVGDDKGRPLGLVAAILIGRVASPESLAAWVELARQVTVRELRDCVRQARANGSVCPPGGGSGSQGSPAPGVSSSGASSPTGTPPEATPGGPCDLDDDIADDAPRELVRMLVPGPVKAAFDEALELFRAIEGHNASVACFVEALVAETSSGPHGCDAVSDVDRCRLHRGDAAAMTEAALSRSTHHWELLPDRSASSWALALAGATLGRFEHLCARAGTGDAVCLDGQIRDLLGLEDQLQRRLGDLLWEMSDLGAWRQLGFDGCAHYAEQRLGRSRSSASERLLAARHLRRLPRVWRAYEQGAIGLEPALHIYRMVLGGQGPTARVDSHSLQAAEQRWLALASTATVKRIRDEVRLHGRRWPGEPAASGGASCRVDDAGVPGGEIGPSDDAAWHASLRREPGMARARVARWGRLVVDRLGGGAGTGAFVPDVFLRLRLAADLASDLLAAVGACRRQLEQRVSSVPWDDPWPEAESIEPAASARAARHYFVRCRRAPSWVGLLAMLEEFVSVWDAGHRTRGDEVYVRDGWRCTAPGCSSRRNLEDHHIVYRSRGGSDDLSNRTCLCRFHHQRGEHGGLASCRGIAPVEIGWRLGRQGVGGVFLNERRIDYGDVSACRGGNR